MPTVQANIDMRQSVMFRNNEERVRKLFNNNKNLNDNKEVELVEPEDL